MIILRFGPEYPAQSPDINIVKNLLGILDNNIRMYKILNKEELAALLTEWQKIILHKSWLNQCQIGCRLLLKRYEINMI